MPFKLRLFLFYYNYIVKPLDYTQISASQLRKINQEEFAKLIDKVDFPPVPMFKTEDRTISMRDGANIPIRIYWPFDKKGLSIVAFFHGGGFVTRNIDSHDRACRRLAKTSNVIVVSVGYRLAPEFKFPIPLQDCYDATVWIAENAVDLGAQPQQLIVAGDSAGGNLATGVCILARNLNGPKIAHQVLIYPTTDARMGHPSIRQFGKGYVLTKKLMDWFLDHYKREDVDILNPLMSPFLEKDLSNLPPAFISTAAYDPLKDEGAAYAQRLKEAGNEVVYKDYKGAIHGFFNLAKITKKQTFALHEDIEKYLKLRQLHL